MKKITGLLFFMYLTINLFAQEDLRGDNNLEALIGTWSYQKNDTVFKINLSTKCKVKIEGYYTMMQLWGSYYLKVGDKVIVDDLNYERPSAWNGFSKSNHVTIQINKLFAESPLYTIVSFYDLQKKHHNGKGIGGGYVKLLAPNKIQWVLDENAGSFETEYPIIGFSVPTDIIMTKEE